SMLSTAALVVVALRPTAGSRVRSDPRERGLGDLHRLVAAHVLSGGDDLQEPAVGGGDQHSGVHLGDGAGDHRRLVRTRHGDRLRLIQVAVQAVHRRQRIVQLPGVGAHCTITLCPLSMSPKTHIAMLDMSFEVPSSKSLPRTPLMSSALMAVHGSNSSPGATTPAAAPPSLSPASSSALSSAPSASSSEPSSAAVSSPVSPPSSEPSSAASSAAAVSSAGCSSALS